MAEIMTGNNCFAIFNSNDYIATKKILRKYISKTNRKN